MPVTFPHGGSFTVDDTIFLAAWQEWFDRHAEDGDSSALAGAMPRLAEAINLAEKLAKGHAFSLEVLCRRLVPCQYQNTMQATPLFVQANGHLLIDTDATNRVTGRRVSGVRLVDAARRILGEVGIAEQREVRAVVEAEIDDDESEAPIVLESSSPSTAMRPPKLNGYSTTSLVQALVDWIGSDPYQPCYRARPVGNQVTGWANRLASYFWPDPASNLSINQVQLAPLIIAAQGLSVPHGTAWTNAQEVQAVGFADAVFRWGGVRQRLVHPQMVRAVFDSLAAGTQVNSAPMNSGWTKVAALASISLGGAREQVIWDSRVAHSLIRRLDALLFAAGCSRIPAALGDIGCIPGRGGTRTTSLYRLNWPNGYRKWSCQFAGSALVRAIRDELNRRSIQVDETDVARRWTLREVEAVLFMDGY